MVQDYARARRDELTDLPLHVVSGALPSDLTGHVFFVGPVGNVNTDGFPGPTRNTVLNGDGMIYRVDFSPATGTSGPQASIKTRLVKPACYFVDEATEGDAEYLFDRYFNAGILRLSLTLGARDFGNTAFAPFQFRGEAPRMLVTFDGGRPLEIDTDELSVVTPVGFNDEWRAEALGSEPFPPVLTTAHPAPDNRTGEMFTVNFGRSVGSILSRSSLLMGCMTVPHLLNEALAPATRRVGLRSRSIAMAQSLNRELERRLARAKRVVSRARGQELPEDFLYVMRWDGAGNLERWRVIDEATGAPAVVEQTMHQIGVTRSWLVLMDTSMKITGGQTFNDPLPGASWLERALRAASSSPQIPFCTLWLVRRDELTPAKRTVRARRIQLPLEAVHFAADYADDDDRITLYVQHDCALDISEWNRDFDLNYFTGTRPDEQVLGVPNVAAMDLNRVARYRIDARTGVVLAADVLVDERCTWGLAIFAGADQFTIANQPERVPALFHTSPGFAPQLLSDWIYDLYADYPHRLVALERIDALGVEGKRSSIFRVDGDTHAITDILEMPDRSIAGALQHVPSRPRDAEAEPGPGYLVCAAIVDGLREIWVIDAGDLNNVVCKLRNDALVYGTTIHAAWLPSVARRTASYQVPAREDFGPRVAGSPRLVELFESVVYPNFGG